MNETKPFRCFDRRYLMKILIATLVVLGLALASKAFAHASAGRLTLVALESAVMGYVIVLTMGTIRRLDEMNQRVHLKAVAVSFAFTGVLGTALGLLERAGLPIAGWEGWLWAFMAFVWVGGVLVIQRRYR